MTPTETYWKGRPVVYRVYDTDERLIYIGASHNMPARLRTHEMQTWWFELIDRVRVQVFPTKDAALAAETVAIQEEDPAFNIRSTGRAWDDHSRLTQADVEVCKAWRDADDYRRTFLPLRLRDHLRSVS